MVDERRKDPRFDCVLVAIIEIEGVSPVRGRVANLSRSGISVVVDEEIAMGTDATFHMRLVRGWSENNFLTLPGRVVRCVPVGGAHQLAGTFADDLEEHASALLDTLIRMLAAQLELGAALE